MIIYMQKIKINVNKYRELLKLPIFINNRKLTFEIYR